MYWFGGIIKWANDPFCGANLNGELSKAHPIPKVLISSSDASRPWFDPTSARQVILFQEETFNGEKILAYSVSEGVEKGEIQCRSPIRFRSDI